MMTSINIDIFDETNQLTKDQLELIENIIKKGFMEEEIDRESEVSVTIVDNKKIQEINREYRGKDAPTDVISFALTEQGEDELEIIDDEDIPLILGDIIISVDKVEEQAKEYGHSFERELAFLTIHGFLHLLGYDHMTEEEEKEMFSKQEEILEAYGLKR